MDYIPAGQRASEAVKAHPEKSDGALATEIGVNPETVRRARKSSTPANAEVEKRVGRDGKTRRMPKQRQRPEPEEGTEDDIEPANYFFLRVDAAIRFATYSGPIIAKRKELVAAARQVAVAWSKLADDLARRSGGIEHPRPTENTEPPPSDDGSGDGESNDPTVRRRTVH